MKKLQKVDFKVKKAMFFMLICDLKNALSFFVNNLQSKSGKCFYKNLEEGKVLGVCMCEKTC